MDEGEGLRTVRLGLATVDLLRRSVTVDGQVDALNPREAELLEWFIEHPVRPASRQELLREVWGYRGGAPTRVVDMTVRRLREKIEADAAAPCFLLTVRGVGYRFELPSAAKATEGAPTHQAADQEPAADPPEDHAITRAADGLALADALLRSWLPELPLGEILEWFARDPLGLAPPSDPQGTLAVQLDALLAGLPAPLRRTLHALSAASGAFPSSIVSALVEGESSSPWQLLRDAERAGLIHRGPDGLHLPQALRLHCWRGLEPGERLRLERLHAAWAFGLRGADQRAFPDEVLTATSRALDRRDATCAAEGCRALRALPGTSSSLAEAQLARINGSLASSEQLVREAVAAARINQDAGQLGAALRDLGWTSNLRGDLETSRAALEEAWTLAREAGDRMLEADVGHHLGVTLLESGDRDGARSVLDASRIALRACGEPPLLRGELATASGLVALADERWDDARGAFRTAARIFEELDLPEGIGWALNNEGEIDRRLGDLQAAAGLYSRAAEWFRVRGSAGLFAAEANRLLVGLERGQYDLDAALDALRKHAEGRRARQGLVELLAAWGAAGRGDLRLDRLRCAREHLTAVGFVEDDVATSAERIADLALADGGRTRRANRALAGEALELALEQRRALGQPERASVVRAALDALDAAGDGP